jgi:pimeloyl-ACP methyl ester carboxylesterase
MLADETIRLRDGRALAYGEWGRPDGIAAFHFHGLPGSRLECWGGPKPYAEARLRLITVDRPGIGRSDPQPDRELSDWAQDVADLATHLGIERFAVLGHSAGSAYALVCAGLLGEQVSAAHLIGPVPRLDRPDSLRQLHTRRYWKAAEKRPWLMRANYRGLRSTLRLAPSVGRRVVLRQGSDADRAAFSSPQAAERFQEAALEALRPGPRGLVDDMRVLMQPWPIRLGEIRVPVFLWHGEQDAFVDQAVSESYAEEIPDATLILIPDEGHYSLPERQMRWILEVVAGRAPTAKARD